MKSLKKTFTKKISKVLLSLLTLSLAFPNGITTSAATVDPTTVNFTVTGELKAGNIVDVAVNVNNATDLYGASIDFAFDKTLVEVQSVTPGTVFPANVNVPVKKTGIVPGSSETAMTLTGAQKATATTGTVAIMKVKLLKDGKLTLKANNKDDALSATGINVRVKLANSTAANMAYTATDKEIVVGPIPVENVKISKFVGDKASSQAINSTITFTATATPATGTTYEFAVQEGTTWVTKQAYSPKNTFAWVPTVAGNYVVKVTAKGTNGSTDTKQLSYVITGTTPIEVPSVISSFESDKVSAQQAGTVITFTAKATPAASSVYAFYVLENNKWVVKQAYSSKNTFSWKPTVAGSYTVRVRVKNSKLSTDLGTFKDLNYTITTTSNSLLTKFTPDKASSQTIGTKITFSANATPADSTVYAFYVFENGKWVVKQSYSATNTFVWTPSVAGNYIVRVRCKNPKITTDPTDYLDINYVIK